MTTVELLVMGSLLGVIGSVLVESMLRHDWIHRWKQIFQISGIEPSPGMTAREALLKRLAGVALHAPKAGANALTLQ